LSDKIRWGILGTGRIAAKFAEGLSALPDAELVAVGSRARDTADAFGEERNVPHRHPSYEKLAQDPDVDVIYVATPHPMHKDNSLLCLENGKAVLCEKPFAINAAEAEAMIRAARERRLFLMEAMWTRFLPTLVKAREWLAAGLIGEPRMVTASFGMRAQFDPESRLFSLALGGGGLLDVGVYAVSFASMVLGSRPAQIASVAQLGETGVDEQAAMVMRYERGQMAVLSCAVRTALVHEASIIGTLGRIALAPPFWRGTTATLFVSGKDDETLELPYEGNGYNCEAAEVMRCLREGKPESDVMPLDESLDIMKMMDAMRAQWGLKYPTE